MNVYAVQHDIQWEDRGANFHAVTSLLSTAAPKAGSLIVLEEMFATGFSRRLERTAEPLGGSTESFLRDLAIHHQCCVIGGMVASDTESWGRNEALIMGPDGSVLARYVKMRPFSLADEHLVHKAGADVKVFDYQGFKIAPFICYDLRFPELARAAVREGADLLVYIANWPIKRVQHWITLLQARAIENLAWVVGVNRCGSDPEFAYPGRSLIVDPHGTIIADAADRAGVLSATIERSVAHEWRSQFPALRDMNRDTMG